MYNPIDIRQIRALVEYRRHQVAVDARRTHRAAGSEHDRAGSGTRLRVAIGTALIRAGVRIAGMYAGDLPSLRPGI